MPEPISLIALTTLVASHASSWLTTLRTTLFDKGKDLIISKGENSIHHLLRFDEKEQLRHIEHALKNATERGLTQFDTLQERDQYKDLLSTLSQPGPSGDRLRQETMQIFTLSQTPDLAALTETYNQRKRYYDPNHHNLNAGPYLQSFFTALIGELYADPYFRPQLTEALQLRASSTIQQSLLGIFDLIKHIGETLSKDYSIEDFEHDRTLYTDHIEQTQRNLKIIGVVPKDRNADPELSGIFVPLRIATKDQTRSTEQPESLIQALEQSPYLVLLGGPGSGKSTATKYLAWSHTNPHHPSLSQASLLSGNPLPLRIELRRLNEERKRGNYDFLSFVTEVLLKREGIEINPQMFKELLTRRAMLLLFDGLDEVATLDERLQLVTEIEHFALRYPGNRILVTSRLIGYQLAPISHPLFHSAEVQNFNDEQIEQFLKNWYSAVLRLTLLPQPEQEELHLLIDTLKENPRLHKLAENPLLLTVITALHRYQRLPDRRVLVYDRCADLLLETWAKLRGTHERWKNMKLTKEDQYACVAYLGFILHERSQEDLNSTDKGESETVDVSLRFISTSVETFIKKQKLIVNVAEQRLEAKRFIALIQEEAGLIVERGTDENSEPLYGFVHRTFQEYFAAADVYERYMQKEDRKIISNFLIAHLHDPHWREVILLLLGKLKSTPVTNQLRQILQGKIKTLRSRYTEIMQQDLFFVCDCLLEEIKVENTLVDMVLLHLTEVVKNTWSADQREVALEYLGKLTRTQQYAGQGMKELVMLAKDEQFDITARLQVFQVLYLYSTSASKERDLAESLATTLINLSVEQVWKSAETLYEDSPEGSDGRRLATSLLTRLVKRVELSVGMVWDTFYWPGQGVGGSLLMELVKREDLSIGQIWQSIVLLYQSNVEGRQLGTPLLIKLVKRGGLSVEQTWKSAELLYLLSPDGSEGRQLGEYLLKELLKYEDLSVEQVGQSAQFLYRSSGEGSEGRKLAESLLIELLKREDLSVEQVRRNAMSLYRSSSKGSEGSQLATSLLTTLVKRVDLSVEQMRQSAESLYWSGSEGSEDRQLAESLLMELVRGGDLLEDQAWQSAKFLYQYSPEESETKQFVEVQLIESVKREDLSMEQKWQNTMSLYELSPEGSEVEQLAGLLLMELVKQEDLSAEQVRQSIKPLYDAIDEGSAKQLGESLLIELVKRVALSIEQKWQIAKLLYDNSSRESEVEHLAESLLIELLKQADFSIEQLWENAVSLYHSSQEGSEASVLVTSILLSLLSHPSRNENNKDVYSLLQEMIPQFHKLPLKVYKRSNL